MKPSFQWTQWRIDVAGIAVIFGVILISYFTQVAPLIDGHHLAKAQSVELAAQQSKAREQERTLRTMTDRLEAVRKAAEKLQIKLESPAELNQRLARLTDLAGEAKLQVDAVESGETTSFDRYSTISIRLRGRGAYRNSRTFLDKLSATMPDIAVVSLQITAGGVTADTDAMFSFELLWHTQPQPRPAKK